MKPLLMIVISVLALLVLLVAVFFIRQGARAVIDRNANREVQPPDFNAADYPPLSDTQGNDRVRIFDTSIYGDKWTSSFYLPEKELFGMTFYSKADPSNIMFFDTNGTQIGVYAKRYGDSNRGGANERRNNHILEFDGYRVVTSAGVGETQPYTLIDEGEPISESRIEALEKQSAEVHVFKHYYALEGSPEAQRELNSVLFKIDGSWVKAVVPSNMYVSVKYDFEGVDLKTMQIQSETDELRPNDHVLDSQFNVMRIWFDRQEFSGARNPSFGSPTGLGRPATWRGIGYYEATVAGHTVKFSIRGKQYPNSDNRTDAFYLWTPDLRLVQVLAGSGDYNFPYTLTVD